MFQSCQHVFLGVQHFLCRFPDISMRFFREHSEMFWRANDNLPLIPSNMEGVVKFTARKVLWVVRKLEEIEARRAFLQRRSDKRKEQPALLCVCVLWTTHLSEDLKTWRRTRHEKHLNRDQSHSTLRRHLKHYHTPESTGQIFHIHKQYLFIHF